MTAPVTQYFGDRPDQRDEITLIVHLDANGEATGTLYEDAGEGMEYMMGEYLLINFLRGDFMLTRATFMQMVYTSVLTMLISPLVLWTLARIAQRYGHTLYPEREEKRRPAWI